MANKIEILENTITKLLFRRGTDSERQSVTFNLGEPAFTTDSKRLFVGDGTTAGGIVVGNKFLGIYAEGSIATVASFKPLTGDYFFNTTASSMYFLSGSNSAQLSSWRSF
jgi:hypothetical protein